jgi:hypothetical protein
MRSAWLLSILLLAPVSAAGPAVSKWAYLGPDHRLHYQTTPRGDRIMDFSFAGYRGGGVQIPAVRVARTLQPAAGDNTPAIQAAIDTISKLPLDAGGFRGALLLSPGVYEVASTVVIAASGVVLRGSGSGDGGTTIRLGGKPHRFLDIHGAGSWQEERDAAQITDEYVPSGSDSFQVDRRKISVRERPF